MDFISRFLKAKYGKVFTYIYMFLILIFTIQYIIFRYRDSMHLVQFDNAYKTRKLYQLVDSIQSQNLKEQRILLEQLTSTTKSIGDKTVILNFNMKVDSLNKKIDNLEQVTLSLRQAINPTNPEEVLTIARLKDEVSILKSQGDNLEKRLNDKLDNLSTTLINKNESSEKATNLVILVLVPILLNFIYIVWKDYKADKKVEQKQEPKTGSA